MDDFQVNKKYSLIDKSFQPGGEERNFASIEISLGGLTYCILDSKHFNYRAIESYNFEGEANWENFLYKIERLIQDNDYLKSEFRRVTLLYVSPQIIFIPPALYKESDKTKYLNFNHLLTNEYITCSDKLYNLDAYSVYPLPIELKNTFNKLFPEFRLRHFSTSLIESILYDIRYEGFKADIVLHIQKNHFEVLVFNKDSELVFFNSFIYQTWDDLLYYLFYVMEKIGLSAENINLLMIGEASMDSEIYKNLKLYFRNVNFGSRSDMYKYDNVFDQIPHHYFYNLLNSHACG